MNAAASKKPARKKDPPPQNTPQQVLARASAAVEKSRALLPLVAVQPPLPSTAEATNDYAAVTSSSSSPKPAAAMGKKRKRPDVSVGTGSLKRAPDDDIGGSSDSDEVAPVPKRGTKSKQKKNVDFVGNISSELEHSRFDLRNKLTTVAGQLEENPNMTLEEAEKAAKHEYNKRNGARARQRNKYLLQELREAVSSLTECTTALRVENDRLRAHVFSLEQNPPGTMQQTSQNPPEGGLSSLSALAGLLMAAGNTRSLSTSAAQPPVSANLVHPAASSTTAAGLGVPSTINLPRYFASVQNESNQSPQMPQLSLLHQLQLSLQQQHQQPPPLNAGFLHPLLSSLLAEQTVAPRNPQTVADLSMLLLGQGSSSVGQQHSYNNAVRGLAQTGTGAAVLAGAGIQQPQMNVEQLLQRITTTGGLGTILENLLTHRQEGDSETKESSEQSKQRQP